MGKRGARASGGEGEAWGARGANEGGGGGDRRRLRQGEARMRVDLIGPRLDACFNEVRADAAARVRRTGRSKEEGGKEKIGGTHIADMSHGVNLTCGPHPPLSERVKRTDLIV